MKRRVYNQDFFEKIDTEEKAYILGLLYADGCICGPENKKYSIKLELKTDDEHIIQKIKKFFGDPLISFPKNRNSIYLVVNSKKMATDLIKLGCTPKKSLTLKFPTKEQVPEHLLSHFIRGYFDGDGCASFQSDIKLRISFIGAKKFIKSLSEFIEKRLDISCKYYKWGKVNVYQFFICKTKNIKKIYDFIYSGNQELFLTRKKLLFEKFLNHPDVKYRLTKTCKICQGEFFAKDLCSKHYQQNYFRKKH